jgi:xanthosine utilization system XapX-like protein
MTIAEKFGVVCSVLLIAFGAFMILGGIINYVEKPAENPLPSTMALLGIMGLAPILAGLAWWRHLRRKAAQRQTTSLERSVLQLAKAHHGVLTVTDVATHTTLSLEEAEQILNQLHLDGFATIDVSDNGALLYHFPSSAANDIDK